MRENRGATGERDEESYGAFDTPETEVFDTFRLGHDMRFVLAAVGGGGIRIAQQIARRHLPYLETVAINCDPRVQDLEEFNRCICLGPESGADPDTGGSAQVGGELARSAGPALQRLFEGAHFVTIIASLGGGTGTGALVPVLEAAARTASALQVFVVKPFDCEGERRALAERTLARLHFVESFVEKRERGQANLQVLDNESLARSQRRLPIAHLDRYWGDVVARLVESELIQPAEAALSAERMAALARQAPPVRPVPPEPEIDGRDPLEPVGPRLAPLHAAAPRPGGVELTFEVLPPSGGGTSPP
jgi:hypothetical protein